MAQSMANGCCRCNIEEQEPALSNYKPIFAKLMIEREDYSRVVVTDILWLNKSLNELLPV